MTPRRRAAEAAAADLDSAFGPRPESYSRPEVVVLRVRRHGKRLLVPAVMLWALAAIAGYWLGGLSAGWKNALLGIALAAGCVLLVLYPVLRWLTERTAVTSRRIIMHRGVFARHRSEVPLARIHEVRTRRSLGQRLGGSGAIDLVVGDEIITIDHLPGVQGIADAITELLERGAMAEQQRLAFGGVTARLAGGGQPHPQQPARPVGHSLLGLD